VTDKNDRPIDIRDDAARCIGVVLDRGQRILHRYDWQILGLQQRNNLVPAGPIGPRAVNESNGGEPTYP
jgi:hypothetical protein